MDPFADDYAMEDDRNMDGDERNPNLYVEAPDHYVEPPNRYVEAPDGGDPGSDGNESSDFEEGDDYFSILKYLSQEWLKVELNHRVSHVASEAFWSLGKSWVNKLFMTKTAQGITRKTPSFIHIRRQLHKNNVPRIHMEIGYLKKDSGDLIVVEDTLITPKRQYPPHEYQKMWEIAHVKVTLIKYISEVLGY